MRFTKRKFVLIWLSFAMVVIIARITHASYLGYDLAIQLQAAQNLLQGRGLTIYSLTGPDDLARPNDLTTLTTFACGYSLYAAALMALGFGLAAVVKTGGAIATILGAWGWAELAYPFVRQGAEHNRFWKWISVGPAIFTPLLYTPPWRGTDIFLWAAIPWVLLCINCAENKDGKRRLSWFDLVAGALCGCALLLRYASLFLALYAGLLILCQGSAKLKVCAKRGMLFAAGLFPFLAAQAYVGYCLSPASILPGSLEFISGRLAIQNTLRELSRVTAANFVAFWWVPGRMLDWLTQPVERAPWLLFFTLVLFLSPVFLALNLKYSAVTTASRDLKVAALGLFGALSLFLIACAPFGVSYVEVRRYYLPLLPISVLAACAFGFPERKPATQLQVLQAVAARAYLLTYVLVTAMWAACLFAPGKRGAEKRRQVIATRGPLNRSLTTVSYEFSEARNYIGGLLRQDRNAILVTNLEAMFYADPGVDWSRLHRFEGLQARYITGPARLIIAATAAANTADRTFYFFTVMREARSIHAFDNFPGLRLIAEFPKEDVKVYEGLVATGQTIPLHQSQ